jgi:hypothetical protein
LKYQVVDIELSLFQQSLPDEDLRPILETAAMLASDKVRGNIRGNIDDENTVFVYRLPVVHNWSYFPDSLKACISALVLKSQKNLINAQVVMWSEDYGIKLKLVSDPNGEFRAKKLSAEDIRQAELIDLLQLDGVFFEHSGDALFDLPSEHYSDYFVRIGNLQSRQRFLSSVFFWATEHLRVVRHIFCDTWSISTTCAIISEFLNLYRKTGIEEMIQQPTSWSFSPGYLPNNKTAKKLLREARDLAARKGGALLVVSSFYSSGTLEKTISDTLRKEKNDYGVKMIAIYGAGEAYDQTDLVMCSIESFVESKGLKGKRAERFSTSELLTVNPLTFFPDYRSPKLEKFKISDVETFADFFETYKGSGVFSVHRNGQNFAFHSRDGGTYSSRHHAFHIDAALLFQHHAFRSSLLKSLAQTSEPFDCVLMDHSGAANELFKAVSEVRLELVVEAKQVVVSDWRLLGAEDDFLAISKAEGKRILIVVPTVISGQSLGTLRRQIRELVPSNAQKDLHFCIGLLRPEGQTEIHNYITVKKYFGQSSSSVVEHVVLPDWGIKECPWCREELTLETLLERHSDKPIYGIFKKMALRLETLRAGKDSGLSGEEVFFSSDDGLKLPFNPGSLFQDTGSEFDEVGGEDAELSGSELAKFLGRSARGSSANEGDLCLVAASAMQNWRIRTRRNNLRRPVIDADSIIHPDKFNEARLRAAIWRCLLPTEKSLAVRSPEAGDFKDLIVRVLSEDYDEHHSCLKYEFILSFARDIRMSQSSISTIETRLFLDV